MTEPILGQIQAFGFSFAPRGWAKCDGQLLPINSNQSLYSLLGTTLRRRRPNHLRSSRPTGTYARAFWGTGPALPRPKTSDSEYGSEQAFLNVAQLPPHSHLVSAPVSSDDGGGDEPDGRVLGSASDPHYSPTPGANQFYKPFNSGNAGGNQGINNMQPYLVVNICIALQGLFPSRN
jgi:microcystin-dependent protein